MRSSDWSSDVCSSDLVQRTGWVLGLLRMASRRGSARQRASAMTGTRFLIPSLLAVGFHNQNPLQAALIDAATTYDPGRGTGRLLQRFHQDHLVTLAQHRRQHRKTDG